MLTIYNFADKGKSAWAGSIIPFPISCHDNTTTIQTINGFILTPVCIGHFWVVRPIVNTMILKPIKQYQTSLKLDSFIVSLHLFVNEYLHLHLVTKQTKLNVYIIYVQTLTSLKAVHIVSFLCRTWVQIAAFSAVACIEESVPASAMQWWRKWY